MPLFGWRECLVVLVAVLDLRRKEADTMGDFCEVGRIEYAAHVFAARCVLFRRWNDVLVSNLAVRRSRYREGNCVYGFDIDDIGAADEMEMEDAVVERQFAKWRDNTVKFRDLDDKYTVRRLVVADCVMRFV